MISCKESDIDSLSLSVKDVGMKYQTGFDMHYMTKRLTVTVILFLNIPFQVML